VVGKDAGLVAGELIGRWRPGKTVTSSQKLLPGILGPHTDCTTVGGDGDGGRAGVEPPLQELARRHAAESISQRNRPERQRAVDCAHDGASGEVKAGPGSRENVNWRAVIVQNVGAVLAEVAFITNSWCWRPVRFRLHPQNASRRESNPL
jgi:hypothetical protein